MFRTYSKDSLLFLHYLPHGHSHSARNLTGHFRARYPPWSKTRRAHRGREGRGEGDVYTSLQHVALPASDNESPPLFRPAVRGDNHYQRPRAEKAPTLQRVALPDTDNECLPLFRPAVRGDTHRRPESRVDALLGPVKNAVCRVSRADALARQTPPQDELNTKTKPTFQIVLHKMGTGGDSGKLVSENCIASLPFFDTWDLCYDILFD